MAKLLSQKIGVGSFSSCARSFRSLLNHTVWHVVEVASTYSVSIEDSETMGCFLDAYETK